MGSVYRIRFTWDAETRFVLIEDRTFYVKRWFGSRREIDPGVFTKWVRAQEQDVARVIVEEVGRDDSPFASKVLTDGGQSTSGPERFRPPCEAVSNLSPTANYAELERRVCPWCRLYFDADPESDMVFCSGTCQRRYHRNLRTDTDHPETEETTDP